MRTSLLIVIAGVVLGAVSADPGMPEAPRLNSRPPVPPATRRPPLASSQSRSPSMSPPYGQPKSPSFSPQYGLSRTSNSRSPSSTPSARSPQYLQPRLGSRSPYPPQPISPFSTMSRSPLPSPPARPSLSRPTLAPFTRTSPPSWATKSTTSKTPPCDCNCYKYSTKLVCAQDPKTKKMETFLNECQVECLNCTMKERYKVIREGSCEDEE